jgi:hypothetical protein
MRPILIAFFCLFLSQSVNAQHVNNEPDLSKLNPEKCQIPEVRRSEYRRLVSRISEMVAPFGFVNPEIYGRAHKTLAPGMSLDFADQYLFTLRESENRLQMTARYHIHRIQDRLLLAQEANPHSRRDEKSALLGIIEDYPALFLAAMQQVDNEKGGFTGKKYLRDHMQSLIFFMHEVSGMLRCLDQMPGISEEAGKVQKLQALDWKHYGSRSAIQTKREGVSNR